MSVCAVLLYMYVYMYSKSLHNVIMDILSCTVHVCVCISFVLNEREREREREREGTSHKYIMCYHVHVCYNLFPLLFTRSYWVAPLISIVSYHKGWAVTC